MAAIEEAIELRQAGIQLRVLMLGLIVPTDEALQAICEYDIEQTVLTFRLPGRYRCRSQMR